MNRRDAVFTLVALGAAPVASVAQQPGRNYRVAVFLSGREPVMKRYLKGIDGMTSLK